MRKNMSIPEMAFISSAEPAPAMAPAMVQSMEAAPMSEDAAQASRLHHPSKGNPRSIRLQLLVTPDTKAALERAAADSGESINELCNRFIAAGLQR